METPPELTPPLILVVDDDEDTRLNLSDILELDGYRVEGAASVSELFARRFWDDVAVVLLDRKLPDGTPQEVVPLLRQKAPQAAVMIVTGYADIEGAIAAVRSGAADYILKPVSPDALRASVRRVLEQQRAEREIVRLNHDLARSEERYRALFENTLDGLLILDDEQGIVAANPACWELGCTPGVVGGKRLDLLTLRKDGQNRAAAWDDFFGSGKLSGECTLVRQGAVPLDVEYRAVENFAPGLHLLSLRDITARRQAEERALQSQRLAAIGETMAALVHESRNALQRSKASLEMLELELEDRPEALKLVARAQRAQDDLHRLYEEVRQWAAPLNLHKETCNLRTLWNEVWRLLGDLRPAPTVSIVEQVTCDPTCQIDRFLMAQVFRNVFENALEVSPPSAAITIGCSSAENGQGEALRITIQDQGPGLTSEQEARLFEPFFTTKAKGTGLGMAIAQRIVQSHGGSIVASSPGGAQIEITLPQGGS